MVAYKQVDNETRRISSDRGPHTAGDHSADSKQVVDLERCRR